MLRRRAIASLFAAVGVIAALVANTVSNDGFLIGAACVIPVLLGLLLQEMLDGVSAAAEGTRARRKARATRPRSSVERERARRERARDRIAA